MSASWSEGYFTDDVYTYGYYRELSPAYLRYSLLMHRIVPPSTEDLSYCELGFGQGLSLNIHAATAPGTYTGTDFNPEQAAFAGQLAADSGSQLTVYSDSFEEIAARDLPQFDYITLHGIWSWISPENRNSIIQFVKKHLKVGGAFYISYNCHPGWSASLPLRNILYFHDKYKTSGKNTHERVQGALNFADELIAAKPNYATVTPGLENRLAQLKKQDSHYIAGEYFNEHWDIMFFMDVVNLLAPAKVNFAASATPSDAIAGLGMLPEAQAFLAKESDPLLREQLRDYCINRQFRKDIFVCGGRTLTPVEQRNLLLREQFVLLMQPQHVKMELTAGMGQVALKDEIYMPVLEALAHNAFAPKTLQEVLTLLEPKGFRYDQVMPALAILVGNGSVSPCQTPAAVQRSKKTAAACNTALCKIAHTRKDISVLGSPLTGSGIGLSRTDQLFVEALAGKQDPVMHTLNVFRANGEQVAKNGVPLVNEAEAIAFIGEIYDNFKTGRLPALKALGIA